MYISASSAPPAYDSVFQRVQTARQQSTSNAGFIKTLPGIIAGSGVMSMLSTSDCFVVSRASSKDTTVMHGSFCCRDDLRYGSQQCPETGNPGIQTIAVSRRLVDYLTTFRVKLVRHLRFH